MRVNWSAILLAGIADWLLQAAWFTIFKTPWQAGTRMSQEELEHYTAHPDFWPYIIALVCNFVIAYVIARLLSAHERAGLFRGIRVGILVGLVAALALVTEMAFEVRPRSFMVIAAGCPFVGCILMGIILGVWKPKQPAAIE